MAPDPRIKKACIAMKALGIPEAKVRPVLRELRKTYDNNWNFIEDENYKVLLDAILEQDVEHTTEKKKQEKAESSDVAINMGKKKALELLWKDEEEDVDEDEAPLKKRVCRKRQIGCDNSMSVSLSSSTSKKPNIEDPKQTQLAVKDKSDDIDERERGCDNHTGVSLGCTKSKKPNEDDHKHTQLAVKDKRDDILILGRTTSKTPNIEDRGHTQLPVKDKNEDMDERERGCDNNTGVSLDCTKSKKPNEEDHKHTQLAVKDKRDDILFLGSTTSKKPKEEGRKLALKDKNDDIDKDKRKRECDNSTGLRLCSTLSKKPNEEDPKPEGKDEDYEMTELPPLKRYLRQTGEKVSARTVNNETSPSFCNSMSMEREELPPIMFLPADPVVAEKESVSSALVIFDEDSFTDHVPMLPDAQNCSASVLEMEKSNIYVEEQARETDVTLYDTTATDVPPSEKVYDMIKTGDESGAADISMGLVVVPECEISSDGWRALSNTKDITFGGESIEIPWVNEVNDEVPSGFRYIQQNYVFQEAALKFSVSSISEKDCCFPCIGDCLDSSMPCNCTIAYKRDGLLKEDFLEARISEARDQRKQVLHFCEECPLEKAKNEDILESCKGHIKRKAMKECWIKCGCSKRCGNRLVQRGIRNKLEVFFTSNGKGWGLRTLERLPQGSFVCEYIGEILTISELYQLELSSPVILDAHWGCSEESLDDSRSLCLDGRFYGNVSRFINHRCLDANLIEIPVHVETPDQHYYHLAFFTTRDIESMEELTWDYGVDFNDEDCFVKHFDCVCGSRFCRNPKRSKKTR